MFFACIVSFSAHLAMQDGITLPEGFKIAPFAKDPLVQDPVAFDIAPDGRVFVAESQRQERGVEDNRSSKFWLMDDLTANSVEDRLAYYEKWKDQRKGGMDYYRAFADRIRRIEDLDGDGQADRATEFSRDFREPLDGTGAGVLVDGADILYTCIPTLWRLRDNDGDGSADATESMFDGFGVRTALRGHDMHGLALGMDGRIYWSLGDRGYRVTTREGEVLADPKSGAVFRCNPDGSHLELFATGLRNPQELAFNELGDLFTGDNNSDGGDRARFVFVMQGGQIGWDMNYQTLEGANQRGPWNQEAIWHLRTQPDSRYPAWTLPPLAHVGSGPSGLAYAPGVGLPAAWDRKFYMCDFLGSETHSGVIAVGVEPLGAGYTVVSTEPFATGVLATDVCFAPDGRMFISAWGGGWFSTGKGTLWAVWDPAVQQAALARQTQALLTAGFGKLKVDELIELLEHPDLRVRRGAQYALASMGPASTLQLLALAQGGASDDSQGSRLAQLAQIHAIWALGMQASGIRCQAVTTPDPLAPIVSMLDSDDGEIRVQAARVLGDARYQPAAAKLSEHLLDENTRVRAACAIACGRLGPRPLGSSDDPIAPICAALWENDDKDPFLRHALVMGLAGCADSAKLQQLSVDQFASVRLGVLLAMRNHADPAIARFLFDPDLRIATEAARAIWDLPIPEAFGALATASGRVASIGTGAAGSMARLAHGEFSREVWKGAIVSSSGELETSRVFTRPPTEREMVAQATGFSAHGDNYLQRLRGPIEPSTTGDFTFYLASDDHSVLFIEEQGVPGSRRVIARLDGYSEPGGWETFPSQVSQPIRLEAGHSYMLEALHAQGGGGNHLAIGVRLPDGTMERPIGVVDVDTNLVAFARRSIAAILAMGGTGSEALARIAGDATLPRVVRIDALAALAEFPAPAARDRVHGRVGMPWIEARDDAAYRRVLAMTLPTLAKDGDGDIRASALELATKVGVALDQKANLAAVLDETRPSSERVACLGQLAGSKDVGLAAAIEGALAAKDADLRIAARRHLATVDPARTLTEATSALSSSTTSEQQAAVRLLGSLADTSDDAISASARQQLSRLLDELDSGSIAASLRLDLIETALKTGDDRAKAAAALMSPAAGTSLTDSLSPNVLVGGNASRGREVLYYNSAAACLRCHAIGGVGGHAGPALDGVGQRLDRRALLQSLVDPGAVIVEGFGTCSAMPPMGSVLTPAEMRDLIEHLTTMKDAAPAGH